jgi:acetoin utilization deacetylase AcuC-like enzyme
MNGTDLLLRDFNVFATTKTNHRAILEQLKQMAVTNNTTGASIYELGNIVKADSISEVTDILRDSETRMEQQREQEMQQQRQMQEQQLQAKAQEEQQKLQSEMQENAKDRQNNITIAEIKAAGFGSMADINQNQESDYKDAMKDIKETSQYREQTNLKRDEMAVKGTMESERLQVEREKIAATRDASSKSLQVARENKNKYDDKSSKK